MKLNFWQMDQLPLWLASPVFEGDEEKTRQAGLVNTIVLTSIALTCVVMMSSLLDGTMPFVTLMMYLFACIMMVQFLLWLRRGRIAWARLGLILFGFVFITSATASLGGITGPTAAIFVFWVLMSGVLFNLRGIVLGTVGASLAILGLIVAKNAGWLATPSYSIGTNLSDWITYTALFAFTGGLTYYINQGTQKALVRAQNAEKAALVANRSKSAFLANMSHDLRTPMNGVLGMAQLLARPQLEDDKRMQYAQTIVNAGHTLQTLLNDILDLSKVEVGKLKLESIDFAVDTLIGDIHALFDGDAGAKGLQLEFIWKGPTGECYLGDPHRLSQILSNLVSNAIKFTASGFVRIMGNEISRHSQHAVLLFSVSDSGVGLTPEQQSRLLQPFSQTDSSITREFGGTGLGLPIVLQLAKLMGGEVGIYSQIDQGSCFWFRVRVAIQPDALHQTPAAAVSIKDLTGSVLIAEDNLTNRMVIMAMLDELGCSGLTVTVVEDGQQALDRITQAVVPPDLVLMDIQMPVMSGLEAATKIRLWQADHGQPRVPIVALTANAFEKDKKQCLDSGMDDFLVKPLDMHKLQATLGKWLGGQV